jgi:two-component system OmpR family sensor kinase
MEMRSLRERIAGIGLRWRIAAWAAIVMLICLAIAFAAVYRGTGTQLRSQTDAELSGESQELSRALAVVAPGTPSKLAAAATRYVRNRPFGPDATLLFVTVPGAGTSTNRPELFRQERPDNGESASEQAEENRLSMRLLRAPGGYSTLLAPDVGDLRLLKRRIRAPGAGAHAPRITVGVGQPLATVAHAQQGVARAFILAGALALLGALLGGYLIGSRASQPLRRIAVLAERVDAGDLHPRIHSTASMPGEVRVLAKAFNHMLDRLTAAFASQRDFVADASHELRTPLTVIRGQLEVLSEHPSPSIEDIRRVEGLLKAEVARVDRLIDDLLLLTQLDQDEFLQVEPIELRRFLPELIASTKLLARRNFQLGAVPVGVLVADPDRLTQALRNLLTNAIKHTAEPDGLIVLRVEGTRQGTVRLIVEDDGLGIPKGHRERVFDRFHRTDPARDRASGGAGLGLAIVQAIALAHGGHAGAGESRMGGARLEMELGSFEVEGSAETSRRARGEPSGSASTGPS